MHEELMDMICNGIIRVVEGSASKGILEVDVTDRETNKDVAIKITIERIENVQGS